MSLPSSSRTRYSSVSSISFAFWLITSRLRLSRSDTSSSVAGLKVCDYGDAVLERRGGAPQPPSPGNAGALISGGIIKAPVVQHHPFLSSQVRPASRPDDLL